MISITKLLLEYGADPNQEGPVIIYLIEIGRYLSNSQCMLQ